MRPIRVQRRAHRAAPPLPRGTTPGRRGRGRSGAPMRSITRRSAAPAAIADGTRGVPSGSTRLTTTPPTRMPARSSVAIPSSAFGQRQLLRQRHPVERGAPRIAQERCRLAAPARRAARSADRPPPGGRRARADRGSGDAPRAARRARRPGRRPFPAPPAAAACARSAPCRRRRRRIRAARARAGQSRSVRRARRCPESTGSAARRRPPDRATCRARRCRRARRRWAPSHRANARRGVDLRRVQGAAASTAPRRTRRGRDERRASSTSPSECAGSVETASTRRPAAAAATARAAAHVVLPTPPFPA